MPSFPWRRPRAFPLSLFFPVLQWRLFANLASIGTNRVMMPASARSVTLFYKFTPGRHTQPRRFCPLSSFLLGGSFPPPPYFLLELGRTDVRSSELQPCNSPALFSGGQSATPMQGSWELIGGATPLLLLATRQSQVPDRSTKAVFRNQPRIPDWFKCIRPRENSANFVLPLGGSWPQFAYDISGCISPDSLFSCVFPACFRLCRSLWPLSLLLL